MIGQNAIRAMGRRRASGVGGAALEFIGYTAGASGALAYPVGYQTDDVLICTWVSYGGTSTNISGLTQIAVGNTDCGVSGEASCQVAGRVITAGDPGSITFPADGLASRCAIFCFRNTTLTDVTTKQSAQCAAGGLQTVTTTNSALTPVAAGAFVVSLAAADGQSSWGAFYGFNPVGTTLVASSSNTKSANTIYYYDDLKDTTTIAARSFVRPKTDATGRSITFAVYNAGTI